MYTDWDIQPDLIPVDPAITIDDCLAAGANGVMISNELYHSLPGISGSNLSLLAESNRHLDNKSLFNLGDTPALTFGTLLHTMVLEPDDVIGNYAIMPNFTASNKTHSTITESKAFFAEDNKNKIIVSLEDFEKARSMAKNAHAICSDTLAQGIKERSMFVDIDGLTLKCRLDCDMEIVGDDFDLKSITLGIKDFSNVTIENHIKKFGYHRSAAFRNIIRSALGKPVRDSYLIFCNTGPGNMVRVIKIHPDWVKHAEYDVLEMLDARRYYLATGQDTSIVSIDDRFRNSTY